MTLDLVIRGGTVHDGSGGEPIVADVAVSAGTIAEVGKIEARAEREIDAAGYTVAPGFIDIHSHSDFTLLADPRGVSAVHQGVTLEVIGNCGFGCFPIADAALAKNAIYGIDDQTPITWTDMAGYLESLAAGQAGGQRLAAGAPRPAQDLDPGHRRAPGRARRAQAHEIRSRIGAGRGRVGLVNRPRVCRRGRRDRGRDYRALPLGGARRCALRHAHAPVREGAAAAVEEAVRTARNAGVRLQVSHLLPRNGRAEGERCIEIVEAARARGQDIAFDMHTRRFGTTYLHTVIPPWAMEAGRTRWRRGSAMRKRASG